MKVSIITCHDVYNYGASLQAYALQTYLKNQQNDVNIINYKPRELYNTYDFWYIPREHHLYVLAKKHWVIKLLLCLRMAPYRFRTWRRIRPFNVFKKKYLTLTRLYRTYDELISNPPLSDVYIAGSDQIWNTKIKNGLDKAYYLDFGDSKTKRFSYAASFAMPDLPPEHKAFVKKELENFDFITVRESTGKNILTSLGYDSELVVDPVFLLDENDWKGVSSGKSINQPYILVYNLNPGEEEIYAIAKKLAHEKSLLIVNVDAILPSKFGDIRIRNAGPNDFIALFQNADYVVTDSFHGMSFSLIFKKPFYVHFKHDNNSRIQDLLCMIGLPNYLNSGLPKMSFDWDSINYSLNSFILQSKNTLIKMLTHS